MKRTDMLFTNRVVQNIYVDIIKAITDKIYIHLWIHKYGSGQITLLLSSILMMHFRHYQISNVHKCHPHLKHMASFILKFCIDS